MTHSDFTSSVLHCDDAMVMCFDATTGDLVHVAGFTTLKAARMAESAVTTHVHTLGHHVLYTRVVSVVGYGSSTK